MNPTNEVVVITGASAGVGRATAHEFARQGARIGLVARNRERLEAAREEVERLGGRALVCPADVASYEQVEEAADAVEKQFGPISVWVNNAMTTIFAPFDHITPAEFQRATEVTYLGFVWGTRAALARMKPRDRGVIVQVGSALAYRSIPLQSPYCGAKHAIKGFTESVRTELMHEKSKVHLTMVQLPALNTPQFHWCRTNLPMHPQPVPPIFQPEVAARAIVWAAHHRRRELYVGASTVGAIIGNKIAPGWLDRYLARTGVKSQQAGFPVEPQRADNLYATVAGDFDEHGEFTDRASNRSAQLWATTHRSWLAGAGMGLAGLALALFVRRGSV